LKHFTEAVKAIVLYKSFLGTAKTYAKWLGEELNCSFKEFGEVKDDELKDYDLVIVVSGTYAGRMPLTSFLKRNGSFWRIRS
jgi:flavodoxin